MNLSHDTNSIQDLTEPELNGHISSLTDAIGQLTENEDFFQQEESPYARNLDNQYQIATRERDRRNNIATQPDSMDIVSEAGSEDFWPNQDLGEGIDLNTIGGGNSIPENEIWREEWEPAVSKLPGEREQDFQQRLFEQWASEKAVDNAPPIQESLQDIILQDHSLSFWEELDNDAISKSKPSELERAVEQKRAAYEQSRGTTEEEEKKFDLNTAVVAVAEAKFHFRKVRALSAVLKQFLTVKEAENENTKPQYIGNLRNLITHWEKDSELLADTLIEAKYSIGHCPDQIRDAVAKFSDLKRRYDCKYLIDRPIALMDKCEESVLANTISNIASLHISTLTEKKESRETKLAYRVKIGPHFPMEGAPASMRYAENTHHVNDDTHILEAVRAIDDMRDDKPEGWKHLTTLLNSPTLPEKDKTTFIKNWKTRTEQLAEEPGWIPHLEKYYNERKVQTIQRAMALVEKITVDEMPDPEEENYTNKNAAWEVKLEEANKKAKVESVYLELTSQYIQARQFIENLSNGPTHFNLELDGQKGRTTFTGKITGINNEVGIIQINDTPTFVTVSSESLKKALSETGLKVSPKIGMPFSKIEKDNKPLLVFGPGHSQASSHDAFKSAIQKETGNIDLAPASDGTGKSFNILASFIEPTNGNGYFRIGGSDANPAYRWLSKQQQQDANVTMVPNERYQVNVAKDGKVAIIHQPKAQQSGRKMSM